MRYQDAVSKLWRHYDLTKAAEDPTCLIQYAILAASSHNTQPWRSRTEPGRVTIMPDPSRRCPVVDPDDHHLWASLGCAAENLLEAAAAAGLRGHLELDEADSGIVIDLEPATPMSTARFEAIPRRQCSRTQYDGSSADSDHLEQLTEAGTGEGVFVTMATSEEDKSELLEYITEGNVRQISDDAWREELVDWIRFNRKRALETRDGLYGGSMGSPDVPGWLGKLILRFALTPDKQNDTDRANVMSSQGVAIFVSARDDVAHWVEAGRCYQRFALTAMALGLETAFANPPVEVPELREQLEAWLGLDGGQSDLIVRFGRGPQLARSLRRPVAQVIEQAPS